MNRVFSVSTLLFSLLMVFPGVASRAANLYPAADSTKNKITTVSYRDSAIIGPDFIIQPNTFLIDDNSILAFGEVLSQFELPFKGKVISKYGMRHGRMHTGTDIKLNSGDTVYAAYHGIVTRAKRYYGYGNLVVLDHSHGLETYYAHLSKITVKDGDTIYKGMPIGLGGRTGRATTDHLHFEIREGGKAYNPELVYDFQNCVIRSNVFGKEGLADLIQNPKTGERISITSGGNGHSAELASVPVPEYVIKAGDNLWNIGRKFQVSVKDLCEMNNLSTNSVLKIGTVLKLIRE